MLRIHDQPFRSSLRQAGYKATPSRLAVLRVLQQSRQPLSPQGIIERLGRAMDQATIYRNLKSLKKTGIIRQVDFRHSHPHYELLDLKDHHHLICTSCGLSEEVSGCAVDAMGKAVLVQTKRFADIREHALEFYGMCKSCLRNTSPRKVRE